ncbi:MAG TPA: flagellar export protein FliJ [Lachnospiraceae bacterium]|nr:flagellar export protein FliJ [Lachnospiraceae bacterium]
MSKFIYRMQNLLNIKIELEAQAKNEFAIANARLRAQEKILNALNLQKDGYEEELKKLYSKNLKIREITETQQAVEVMKYRIRLQILQVKHAQKNVETARLKLQEVMQERKKHEKLKEKKFEQFLLDEAADERKAIDELVSYRHGHKKEE